MKNNEIKKVQSGKAQSFGLFLNRNAGKIAASMMLIMAMSTVVFATTGADALWTTLADTIKTWVTRLGGVVMLVGGITFGLGWSHQDAAQKNTGLTVMVSGGIVIAVAQLTGTFFA